LTVDGAGRPSSNGSDVVDTPSLNDPVRLGKREGVLVAASMAQPAAKASTRAFRIGSPWRSDGHDVDRRFPRGGDRWRLAGYVGKIGVAAGMSPDPVISRMEDARMMGERIGVGGAVVRLQPGA
jgi:hypothetical protein